jgi:hypothetical protein
MQKSFISVLILAFLWACSAPKTKQDDFVKSYFDFASQQWLNNLLQLKVALTNIEKTKETSDSKRVIPRALNTDGSIQLVDMEDGTCGFFSGELWYLYEYTQDEFWKMNAAQFPENLEAAQFNTHDHDTYYKIAVSHAPKTLENHFREDDSSYHVVDYDIITGKGLQKHTHQGYAHESTRAHGQAWGAYGFTMCYRETKDPAFLQKAEQIIDFLFKHPHLPSDLISYWDYDAPDIPNEPRDVSASAITASALYELSLYSSAKAEQYKKWANTILESLSKNYYESFIRYHSYFIVYSL